MSIGESEGEGYAHGMVLREAQGLSRAHFALKIALLSHGVTIDMN